MNHSRAENRRALFFDRRIVRTLMLGYALIFSCNSKTDHSEEPADSRMLRFYGPGINADALANTTIGGPFLNTTAYSFRANRTGVLQAIRVYVIWNTSRPGYSGGTGGSLLFSVQTDDNTPNHHPSGTTLASVLHRNPLSEDPFPVLTFSSPPQLQSGRLYHLVITNTDPDPATNYVSVNSLWMNHALNPHQPTMSDLDWSQLLGNSTRPGEWMPRDRGNNDSFTPILELTYEDGYSTGVGYMEVWIGSPMTISGSSAVRQTFMVSGPDRKVLSVSARVKRNSGNEPLTIRIEQSDSTLIEQGSIVATSISTESYVWVTYRFSTLRLLGSEQRYNLVFTAPASTSYEMFPLAEGRYYSFKNTTYFADGYAQFTTGSSWVGWTQWGKTNRIDGDLQFYFTVVP